MTSDPAMPTSGADHGASPALDRVALVHSDTAEARGAAAALRERHRFVDASDARMIVALGGDGFMLQTLHAMLDQGVHLPPSVFESWFVSAAHDDEAVGRILDALPAAAAAAATDSGVTIGR